MLKTYNVFEAAETGIAIEPKRTGDFTTDFATITDLGGALKLRPVTILSFIDMLDATQKDWLANLQAIYLDTTIPASSILVIGVLYYFKQNVNDGGIGNQYDAFLLGTPGTNYVLLKNTTWGGTDTYLAYHFYTGLDIYLSGTIGSTQVGSPFTYIIHKKTGPAYWITDKLYATAGYNAKTASSLPLYPADTSIKTNLVKFSFGGSAAYADMQNYIIKRVKDCIGTSLDATAGDPKVLVYPDTDDTTEVGTYPARVRNGSKIRFTFSEKGVGTGDFAKYKFTEGANTYLDLFVDPVVGDIPDTNASPADGLKASEYATKKESWVGTFTNLDTHVLDTKTITFDPSLLVDGSNTPFTLDPANIPSFLVDLSATPDNTVTASVTLVDDRGTGTERTVSLSPTATPELAVKATRALRVSIRTKFPGVDRPTATLHKPDGNSFALTFPGLIAAEITEDDTSLPTPPFKKALDLDGVYWLHIDQYTNGAGTVLAARDYRFAVITSMTAYADQLEGWGYYPREEGAPDQCPEPTASILMPDSRHIALWASAGGDACPFTSELGKRLFFHHTANVGTRSFKRAYLFVFKSDDGGTVPYPSGRGYIEAAFFVTYTTPSASTSLVTDATNPAALTDVTMRTIGAGLMIRNGPFVANLWCVEVQNGLTWDKKLAVSVFEPATTKPAYAFASLTWTSQVTLRIEKTVASGEEAFDVKQWASGAFTSLFTSPIPVRRMPGLTTAAAEVAFGVFEDGDAVFDVDLEYVRYAFADARFVPAANALKVGFANLHRTSSGGVIETKFFRSPDIKIVRPDGSGSSDTNDPESNDSSANRVTARLAVVRPTAYDPPTSPTSIPVPIKVRFCLADWDDSAEDSTDGFFKTGTKPVFPTYVVGGNVKPLTKDSAAARPSTGIVLSSSTTPDSSIVTWNFTVNSDLSRRLFVLACADAPYLDPPQLVGSVDVNGYLNITEDSVTHVRSGDIRLIVRQFLPDYYVRGSQTDVGAEPYVQASWLSPDVTLGIFRGPGGTPTHVLPDPQGTAQHLYPRGWALGELPDWDNLSYYYANYTWVNSQILTPTPTQIKLTDSGWSDYEGSPAQCYYNRVWVRLSNRGIVPGPARVQIFFIWSNIGGIFDPSDTTLRDDAYEKICATSSGGFVQDSFQIYDVTDPAILNIKKAIPALSGASDPSSTKNFAVAEFIWHTAAWTTPAGSEIHGCRTVCINLTDQAGWSSGVDETPALGNTTYQGDASNQYNNITIRNSNIVIGSAPVEGDPSQPWTEKAVVEDDTPVNYQQTPNDYHVSPPREHTVWGIRVDARRFPVGNVVLRIDKAYVVGARAINMAEIKPRATEAPHPDSASCYYQLKGGGVGELMGLKTGRLPPTAISLFFQPNPHAAPGLYQVTLSQILNGRAIGGYRTAILIPKEGEVTHVGDARTKVIYDLKKHPDALKAIPYEKRVPFTGPGHAVQEGFRLGPAGAVDMVIGKLKNEIANVPKGFKYPRAPKEIAVLPGCLEGAVIGRVLGAKGELVRGHEVILYDRKSSKTLGKGVTDKNGRYLIRLETDRKTISTDQSVKILDLAVADPTLKKELMRVGLKATELFFAATDIRLKV